MREKLERIQELYSNGGIREIYRGIRDYALIEKRIPIDLFYMTKDLSAAGESVTLNVEDSETVWRTYGFGEKRILNDYTNRVDSDSVVWDIGANIGTYSLLAAKKGARVYAFEPGIYALSQLQKNAEINDLDRLISGIPVGLSNENGFKNLTETDRTGTRQIGEFHTAGDIVPISRGDTFTLPKPSVVKIDVEGHEKQVLEGMRDTLLTTQTVYIELHDTQYMDVLSILFELGFEITEEWNERTEHTHMRLDK